MMRWFSVGLVVAVSGACSADAVAARQSPEELGDVRWGRDFAQAQKRAAASGKPMFVLFTEVPGCSTVKGFGRGPLRHPLIVEAIESLFVPVAVYNNVGGRDREVLESFGEPSWNNPVVRIMDADRRAYARRFAGPYDVGTISARMIAALESAERTVPDYLRLLSLEENAKRRASLFSMYCFWSGEVGLASLPGVVSTRTGFAAGREVVEVIWDARQTSLPALVAAARASGAASGFVATSEAELAIARRSFSNAVLDPDGMRFSEEDDKYQIRRGPWRSVRTLLPSQATRINRAVTRAGDDPRRYLSPRQLARLDAGG